MVLDCFHEVKQLLHEGKTAWILGNSSKQTSTRGEASAIRPPSCKVWCKTANNISVLPAPVTAHTKRFSSFLPSHKVQLRSLAVPLLLSRLLKKDSSWAIGLSGK